MKKFDFYGNPFKLHVAGHYTITSSFGGCLSIITTILMLVYVYFNGSDIFFREDPWTYQENQTLNSSHSYNFTNTDFRFYFNLFYGSNKSSFEDTTYIKLKFVTKWRKDKLIYIKTFPMKRCSEASLENLKGTESDYILERLVSKNYICPSFENFTLGGSWVEQTIEYAQIQVYPCNNKTDNVVCKPLEVINDYIWTNRIYFSFYYPLSVVRLSDYEEPIIWNLKEDYFYIGNLLKYRFINYALDKISITTDYGFLFREESVQEGYAINIVSFDERIPTKEDPYFFSLDFYSSFNLIWYHRSYIKLLDIIANFGGMLQIVTIVFSFFVSLFFMLQRTKFMTDKIFNFDDLRFKGASALLPGLTLEQNENDKGSDCKRKNNELNSIGLISGNKNSNNSKNKNKHNQHNTEISKIKKEINNSIKLENCDCDNVCSCDLRYGDNINDVENRDGNHYYSNSGTVKESKQCRRNDDGIRNQVVYDKNEVFSNKIEHTFNDKIEMSNLQNLKNRLDCNKPVNSIVSRSKNESLSSVKNTVFFNNFNGSFDLVKNKTNKDKDLDNKIKLFNNNISLKTVYHNKSNNRYTNGRPNTNHFDKTKNDLNFNQNINHVFKIDSGNLPSELKEKKAASVNLIMNECENNINSNSINNTNINTNFCENQRDSERNNFCDKNLKSEFNLELNLSKLTNNSQCLFKAESPTRKDVSPKANLPSFILENQEAFGIHINNSIYDIKEYENKKNFFVQKLISKKRSDKLKLNCLQKSKFLFLSCLNLKKLKATEDYKYLMLMRLIHQKIENFFDYLNVINTIEETSLLKEILLLDHQKLIVSLLRKETLNVSDIKGIDDIKRVKVQKEIENEAIAKAVDELIRTCSLEYAQENFNNPVKLNKSIVEILDDKIKI